MIKGGRFVVLQHVDVEHPGTFRDLWSEQGHVATTVELDQGDEIPPLDSFDLMVVMGGPMDVWEEDRFPWLVAEKAAIRHWVADMRRPFLGICLGHQLLAASLGGEVGFMRRPEVGLADVDLAPSASADRLLAGLGSTLGTFQWHSAEVSRLPPDAAILASNTACAAQAIRVGRHAYGLQFHCEITSTTVVEWQEIPAYRTSLEEALGVAGASDLEGEVAPHLDGFARTARRLNDNLMAILGLAGAAEA